MRSYGRFTTSIWRDQDFTSLTYAQQAVYFMLATQPDVTAAGSLALTAGRWSKLAAATSRVQVEELIVSLAEHQGRHLVVDEDTEELLIRTFIKWDGGYSNSKRLPVIIDAAKAIASVKLRHAVADELAKLGVEDAASQVRPAEPDRAYLAETDTASSVVSPSDRVVVKEGDHSSQPTTLNPEREPFAADADEPLSMFCSKHPYGTEKACGPCQTARLRYAAAAKAKLAAELAAKADRAKAIAACARCDDQGLELHPETKLIIGRCDHGRLSEVS